VKLKGFDMASVSEIVGFEAGVFIRIDDVMSGTRKLARVTETRYSYIDLDGEDASAFPIYKTLNPEEAGNILGWGLYVVDKHPEDHHQWQVLVDRLINCGEGYLTYNRAAHWAFVNRQYDFDKAIAAGKAETAQIAKGRAALDAAALGSIGSKP
jgi:hypothetical protein